jgi:hypothetical protein
VLKDSKGETIKEWKFADGTTSNRNMVISIKDLVQSTKATDENQFTLYYTAKESSVQKLAVINMTDKTLATTDKHIPEFSYLWAAGLFVAAIVTLYYRLA